MGQTLMLEAHMIDGLFYALNDNEILHTGIISLYLKLFSE